MSIEKISQYVSQIKQLDANAMARARERLVALAKPPGSLGRLEDIAALLSGMSGEMFYDSSKRCVIVMSSDNGVYEEGVASTPQSVTYSQTVNFAKGLTGVAVIAKQFNADLIIVDVGVNADIDHPLVINRKIRKSTWNIAKGPAMTRDEAAEAVLAGIETAAVAAMNGYKMIGVGEMGIANTTTSAAVLCALAGVSAEEAAGKGAGLGEDAYKHKIDVIKTALDVNKPDSRDPIDVLAKVGGFDIAAMAGVYIGGALKGIPMVIDGFISMVAALVAARLAPVSKDYMLASHSSYEQGFAHAANALEMRTYLDLEMRLGEGSGCPIMFAVVDAACAVMRNMATFEEAEINDDYVEELTRGDMFTV
ncbi:MAG: nicotinate-nucleotide--dimethylbenzimidazole phosphoribosyltransferase [Oscillospiraceae bacterium]|nr:nicotinate-nucleotide--dimethylbenzimidazole phosphoribosyltransferase [Oscillospiraceae bacterium]